MKLSPKNVAKFVLRWGIAIVGIWYVLSNLAWYNYVLVADAKTGLPDKLRLVTPAQDGDATFSVYQRGDDHAWHPHTVDRSRLIARPDYDRVTLRDPATETTREMQVLGRRVVPNEPFAHWPLVVIPPRGLWDRYWNNYAPGTSAELVDASTVIEPTKPAGLQYPLIEEGLQVRVSKANPWILLLAMAVYPVIYGLTTWRWWLLMRIVDVRMPLSRAFAINMVGSFYNSFLLGSTGGDVIKAVYAARNSNHRTRAVISVMVDRVIGLYGLIVLGGTIAGAMWLSTRNVHEYHAVADKCRQVFFGSALILVCTVIAMAIYYVPTLRKLFLVDWVLSKLPMQHHVQSVRDTADLYGKHLWLTLATVAISLPVHGIVVLSVSLSCIAFGLPLTWWYYWVVVPITVLSGAIPISPQGAGVMEFFALILMRSQGATMTDVVTLTVSIRIIGILWNLTGGVYVMKGGFGKPVDAQHELEEDMEHDAPAPNTSPA
ncbi:MAG: lysylphosphatidylglycerol synthase transmembrane domain-containing protein [Tepidisphaeraceae bacterium]